ncbi:hypothetical protein J3R30DRAFT_3408070 [Lentinula aciculospora]|uniref:ubiquitinyl hydrolase 1 n=1 Tax=Lentinula aciculospora TaxID=153920 RepID=A0A9W8ZZ89_9AGAR|nr:hypothetical protein J3R30DRAFT_3408070 [Lentinula aciculospora]
METNKPRRPLPTPGSRASPPTQRSGTPATAPERPSTPTPTLPPRPNTPALASGKPTPVPASSFYADFKKTEKRPAGLGSSSTTFTDMPLSEDYRPPELIPEDDEPPPRFIHAVADVMSDEVDSNHWFNQGKLGNQWGNQSGSTAYPAIGWGDASTASGWGNEGSNASAWGVDDATNNNSSSASIAPKIPITSRHTGDEIRWWDREYIWARSYPGKGALPVLMAESVEAGLQRLLGKRAGSKGLYKVEVTPPDILPLEQREGNSENPPGHFSHSPSLIRTSSNSSLNPSSTPAPRPKSPRPRLRSPHVPPSPREIELAGKPHPDAYFSPKENAWIILSWRDSSSSSSTRDPLPLFIPQVRAYTYMLPRPECRMESNGMGVNCIAYTTESGPDNRAAMGEQHPHECHNLTHHFHKYPKSIDGRTLDPPVRHWKDDFPLVESDAEAAMDVDDSANSDGIILLDAYVCCQCSFFLVVSSPSTSFAQKDNSLNVIPGVIPLPTWNAYVDDRLKNPNPSMSKEQTLLGGLETLLIIIQNHLWKGESRNIKVNGLGFSRRLGWGEWIQSILQTLSFHPESHKNPANPQVMDIFLRGPVITPTTSEGRLNRRKLIRAWVEISSWIAEWKERDGVGPTLASNYKEHDLWVKLNTSQETVRKMYQRAVGAHIEQLPRLDLPNAIIDHLRSKEVADQFIVLGLTPTAWSADLLCFAYLSQMRCDPAHTPTYFNALQVVMNVLLQLSSVPEFAKAFVSGMDGNVNDNSTLNPALLTSISPASTSPTSINLELITNLYIHEETRGRWSEDSLISAIETLGFTYTATFKGGKCGWLNIEWDGDLVKNQPYRGDAYGTGYSRGSMYAWDIDNSDDERDRVIWETGVYYSNEELENLIPDDCIANAWKECAKRDSSLGDVEMDGQRGGKGKKEYTDALRIVAESRGSAELINVWHDVQMGSGGAAYEGDFDKGYSGGGPPVLTLDGAYQALEVPLDIDDAMLITVYQMRVEDSPTQLQKMQMALQMISEARNSERLKEFARTMKDPGEHLAPMRADWPRGLNQLGNTCYLNSLLQYFYTIKELRSSIITVGSMSGMNTAGKDTGSGGEKDQTVSATSNTTTSYHSDNQELSKNSSITKLLADVTDDDLKRHRVGGRLVTRREIVRSKQFVSHLADLFHKLEYADNPAVTPSIELAKLALVTSKDEEEEVEDDTNKADSQSHKAGTDSSQDTDATLVEDLPPRPSHPPPYHTSDDSSSSRTERPHRTNSISSSSSSMSHHSPHSVSHTPPSPTRSPSSVLGKRPRGAGLSREDTELLDDHPIRASSSVSPPPSSVASFGSVSRASSGISESPPSLAPISQGREEDEEDVVMRDASPARELPKPSQNPPPLPPRRPAPPVHNDSVMMFGKQHDVAECMDNCMFQIETALLKFHGGGEMDDAAVDEPEKTSVVKRLFYGKMHQTFIETLKGEPTKHEKEDLFSHLPVNVGDEVDLIDRSGGPPPYDAAASSDPSQDLNEFSMFDIYDGLGRYFDDTIEYEGQKVPMEVGLVKLPPLLQVQLQRVQFNRELLQSWKSQAYVKFGETLYMDRFMDTADPEKRNMSKKVQDELNTCRERLKVLSKGKFHNVAFSDALKTASTFLSSSGALFSSLSIPIADPPLSSELTYVQTEIHRLRTRIPQLKAQLESLWVDNKEVEYELTSVFIHRGSSPSFGHYFFYSRNLPEKPDAWFKYNDEDVSEVGKEEVFRDTTGETANPYLLVFARKGSQVVETVNRFDPALLDGDVVPS